MDERDLCGLADEPLPQLPSNRSVESVIRRGNQLRHRRYAVRTLGATSLVVGILAAGILAQRDPPAGLSTDEGPQQEGNSNIPYFLGCDGETKIGSHGSGPNLPPEETDRLRFLPDWLPNGMAVDRTAEIPLGGDSFATTGQSDSKVTLNCRRADPALVLRATGGDDTVEAGIKVEGPYPGGIDLSVIDNGSFEATELRGLPAHQVRSSGGRPEELVAFTWTEPDGAGWWIEGLGTDEATVRAVAEALQLASAAPSGTPTAALPDEAMPEGFETAWQVHGLPAEANPVEVQWSASFANAACYVIFQTGQFEAAAGMRVSAGGVGTLVTVRGQEGLVTSYSGGPPAGGTELVWQESPEIVGRVGCNRGIDPNYDPGIEPDVLRQIADSLVPVEPDDPRFG